MSKAIIDIITQRNQYRKVLSGLQDCSEPERIARIRNLCREDLYFLLRYALNGKHCDSDWVFDRCREVQREPNGRLDLWAREHFKSTIITFGLTIQEILNDPNLTFGIFSHTRPLAKQFLRQIKYEFEANDNLRRWFPDILWENPQKEAPKWSEDDGIVLRRTTNPKEATVEAWGLVDGQPTSKHFKRRIYDDIVVESSVTTPEMMAKTTKAFELSDNLGSEGDEFRMVGTRYHFSDSYGELVRRGVVTPRVYPCTKDGSENFKPENCWLMSAERLVSKRRTQGPYTFGTQMLLNPKGDENQGFRREWVRHHSGSPRRYGLNTYIVVDPANSKKKTSDWTSMWVIGLGADQNYIVLEMVRDRLSLQQRANELFRLHAKWLPLGVGYEEYGLQADIQHIEHRQDQENYRFKITPLKGAVSKQDRIKRLIPLFEQGRMYLPPFQHRTIYDGTTVDLVSMFIEEEYVAFPVSLHDDMLDSLARIEDPDLPVKWPKTAEAKGIDVESQPQSVSGGRGAQAIRSRFASALASSNQQPRFVRGGGEHG